MRQWTFLLSFFAYACAPDLGPCDAAEARGLVYDEGGSPAYEGQALMIRSCGHGAFCHSVDASPDGRFGAPAGLDYDLRIAPEGGTTERLAVMHERTFRDRRAIWASVTSGAMPPRGGSSDALLESAPRFFSVDAVSGEATPLPDLDDPAARETLRNWLACGLPIVERADDGPGAGEIGDVVSPNEVMPLMPRWSDIHDRLIVRRCASAPCHGAAAEGELRLDGGRAAALAALLDAPAAGSECLGEDALVVPGAPDASLLVHKLVGRVVGSACTDDSECTAPARCIDAACSTPVCGDLMPIGGSRVSAASIEAIREWIAAGALDD